MTHLLEESNTGFWCLAALVSSAAGAVQLVDSLPDSSSTPALLLDLLLKYLESLDTLPSTHEDDCFLSRVTVITKCKKELKTERIFQSLAIMIRHQILVKDNVR